MTGRNRLADATSPYLLQHADNPVDWWPWSDDAFAEAARRDVPVLLSVGYAACHWCHVMAHESFEDDTTAAEINDGFVAVKVDREERPDVDAVYMQATQAMTGQGGWPMTVFLTPDRRPFYAGTYFPPRPAHGMPAFRQVLDAIAGAWRDRRDEVLGGADEIVRQLAELSPARAAVAPDAGPADVGAALTQLGREFDPVHAGFGRAPKFPPSMVIEALLRTRSEDSLTPAVRTLTAMARGGIHDQLRGGFARYSVDVAWGVPHFEKMLYDNGLLLGDYVHWWRLTGDPVARDVVFALVGWLVDEMRTGEGGFAASLDADSLDEAGHLHEGAYYAWNPAQLVDALGHDDGAWAAEIYGVTTDGTFEHGLSTLRRSVAYPAPGTADAAAARLESVRSRLLEARARRARPGRDDKVVAAWNGWTVDSLVQAAMIFDRPDWLDLARRAAEFVWSVHWLDGRLRRTSREGRVGSAPAILEDYGALIQAFSRLATATTDPAWIDRAGQLAEVVLARFDDGDGGFFDTADDAERLYTRPQDPTDNATPSGLSSAVHGLRLLGELTGDDRYVARADAAAATSAALVTKAPRFAGWLLADAISQGPGPAPVQVAVVGPADDPARADLLRTAWQLAPAGSVVVAGLGDDPGFELLADRGPVGGKSAAYVCRHFVCKLPVTDVDALAAQLSGG